MITVSAAHLGHLDEEQADAARARVDEGRIVGAERVRGMGEIVGGHALEHGRRALLCRDAARQDDEAICGDDDALGVGLGRAGIGDDIADGRSRDAVANLNDGSRALAAEDGRQRAAAIQSGSAIHIHVVDAGGGELHDGLAGAGGGVSDVRVGENLGAAVLGDLDCFHGVVAPWVWLVTGLQIASRVGRDSSGCKHRINGCGGHGGRGERACAADAGAVWVA